MIRYNINIIDIDIKTYNDTLYWNMEATVSTNNMNNYSISELNYLCESIQNMNKFNQIEILKIFNKHKDVTINENKYGIHVNLSEVKKEVLDEMSAYVKYVNTQEKTLHLIEQQKEDYKNIFFNEDIASTKDIVKDIKDNSKHNIA